MMEEHVISVHTLDDQEEVAQMFSNYDFLALPVVDNEQRIVGIVTIDDAIDVIQEEATEDIEKMAAVLPSDKPYMRTGVFGIYRKRVPWLLVLMLSATFTSTIISSFDSVLAQIIILSSFIPMITGSGGNAGSQASVSVIRALSLGEIEFKSMFKVLWKEVRVAVLCGITLAAANFVKLILFDLRSYSGTGDPVQISLVAVTSKTCAHSLAMPPVSTRLANFSRSCSLMNSVWMMIFLIYFLRGVPGDAKWGVSYSLAFRRTGSTI